jgi:hypothetical protein
VKSTTVDFFGTVVLQQLLNAGRHFKGSFAGKGKEQYFGWCNVVFEHESHTVNNILLSALSNFIALGEHAF